MLLEQEDLQKLRQAQTDHSTVLLNIGEISLQIEECRERLFKLEGEKEGFFSTHRTLKERNDELSKELFTKYGAGSIDLQTGEITPAQ